jgi:hypothetical protein
MTLEELQKIAEFAKTLGFIVRRDTEWDKNSFAIYLPCENGKYNPIIDNTFNLSNHEIISVITSQEVKKILHNKFTIINNEQCSVKSLDKDKLKNYLIKVMTLYKNELIKQKKQSISKDFQ